MVRTETDEFAELTSEQRSEEVQYGRFSIGTRAKSQKGTRGLFKHLSTMKRFSSVPPSSGQKRVEALLGNRRSLDYDEGNHPGQDFAAVRGGDGGYVVGVVADGVSRSFYGNIAAYHVGKWLVNTLWQERESLPSRDRLEEKLKELEKELAPEVESYSIPQDIAPTLMKVLENRRPKGSQAVFAAFVWNAQENNLCLYQVGDIDALVHYPDKSPELVQAAPTGRWSSAGKSEMRLEEGSYEGISGIVIKSDGASKDWGESLEDNALDQSAFERLARERAGYDDISFVAAYRDVPGESPVGTETRTEVVTDLEGHQRLGSEEAFDDARHKRRRKRRRNRRRKAVLLVAGIAVCVLLAAAYLFISRVA